MTMLTRCAACGSTFRITPEQLAARQGTVRCGACGEVFSAIPGLAQSGQSSHDSAPGTPDTPVSSGLASAPPTALRTAALDSTPELTSAEIVLNASAATLTAAVDSADGGADGGTAAPDAAVPSPALGPAARPASRHWGSFAGALVTIALLGFQAAYFYRNEAAAHFPETKPWLQKMCIHLSCRFDVPRDAQAISIESHDLQADPANKNLLALIALLRNRAGFAQDAPHLELTLTDAQDAPIARRVLTPRDYFAAAPMGAGAELQIRLSIDAGQARASGYRLYAFYP